MVKLVNGATYKVRFRSRKVSQRVRLIKTYEDTWGTVMVFEFERARNHPADERYRMVADVVEIEVEKPPVRQWVPRRTADLHSVRRFAEWRTSVENEGAYRVMGVAFAEGPVVELELGYRSAAYFLNPDRRVVAGAR